MLHRFRLFITGILINLQFFTSIPINKQLALEKRQLKYALQTFPILGLIQGGIYAGFLYFLESFTPFSSFMITLLLWLLLIILSGGIHLDGWIDASDAYFSYKDSEKRLDIMKDPRVGAFGVLSIIVFLFVRFVVLYEIIQLANADAYLFIILIPFFGKTLLGIYLQSLPLARKEGMASFFRQGESEYFWAFYTFYILLLGGLLAWFHIQCILPYFIFVFVFIIVSFFIAGFIKRNFNGISGDTLGASSEGMELLLWLTLWLLLSYAMV